ncbi:hypothetical protein TorRG33x02_340270, partial [Trema orientale]
VARSQLYNRMMQQHAPTRLIYKGCDDTALSRVEGAMQRRPKLAIWKRSL